MKALILAAGEGRRLYPLTQGTPKPMLPIVDVPVLERTLRWLQRYGVTQVAINLHYCGERIRAYFEDGSRWHMQLTYSYEPMILGTAGATIPLSSWLTETFLVVYGDNLFDVNLLSFISYHQKHRGDGTVALHYRDNPTASGIAQLDEQGRMVRFLEKPQPQQIFSRWVSAGLMVWESRVLADIPAGQPCDWGRDLLPRWVETKRVFGYQLGAVDRLWWIDTPEDYRRVQAEFAQRAE